MASTATPELRHDRLSHPTDSPTSRPAGLGADAGERTRRCGRRGKRVARAQRTDHPAEQARPGGRPAPAGVDGGADRLEGFLQGDHLGLLPGPGSDLNDARIYVPGEDDVRRMDWAVTARTMTPHVRDTMADRELEVWALLDASPSMNWGTAGITKRDLGIAAIATLGFISQKMGDRFGGLVMHFDSVRRFPARSGRQALYGLLGRMLEDPIEKETGPPPSVWPRASRR